VCPFADKIKSPCGGRMTLENILEAVGRCANDFKLCPVYQKLLTDECDRENTRQVSRLRAAS